MCNGQTPSSPSQSGAGRRRRLPKGDETSPKQDISDIEEVTSDLETSRPDLGDEARPSLFDPPNQQRQRVAWNEKEGSPYRDLPAAAATLRPGDLHSGCKLSSTGIPKHGPLAWSKRSNTEVLEEKDHTLWFGSGVRDSSPELGKLTAYCSAPTQPGMSKPPQNPAVQQDLLKYLQSRNVPACVKASRPVRKRSEQQTSAAATPEAECKELFDSEGPFQSARSHRLNWSPSVQHTPLPWNRQGKSAPEKEEPWSCSTADIFKGVAESQPTSEAIRRQQHTAHSQTANQGFRSSRFSSAPHASGFNLLKPQKPKPLLNDQQLRYSLTTLRRKSVHHGLDQDQQVDEAHDLRVYHNPLVRTGTASSTREKAAGMMTPRLTTPRLPRVGTPLRSSTPMQRSARTPRPAQFTQDGAANTLRGLRQMLEDNMSRSPPLKSAMEQELQQVHQGIKGLEPTIDPSSPKRRSLQRLRTSVRIASQTVQKELNTPRPGAFLKTVQKAVDQKELLKGAKTMMNCPWLRGSSVISAEELAQKLKVASPAGKVRITHLQ